MSQERESDGKVWAPVCRTRAPAGALEKDCNVTDCPLPCAIVLEVGSWNSATVVKFCQTHGVLIGLAPGPGRMEFFVPMIPRRKNRLRIVRAGAFHKLAPDEKGKEAQATLAARILEHKPLTPLAGAVWLGVVFTMPIPKTWKGWRREAAVGGRIFPVSRPDRGNLLKLLEDAMKGIFYNDDSLVVDGPVGKRYGEVPGYRITLAPLVEAVAPPKPVKVPKVKRTKTTTPAQDGAW